MADSDNRARRGINAVEAAFLSFGWIFREQTISDWGIDAHVEVCERGKPTGKLIALQIKSGASFFRKRGKNYVFYGKERHLDYWENHSLPVFLILHNPVDSLILWQRVERRSVKIGRDGAWSISIPPENILNEHASRFLSEGIASDPEAIRRFMMSIDAPYIREFNKNGKIFFTVDEWVNKSLNFRKAEVRFKDPDKQHPDMVIQKWMPAQTLEDFMAYHYPWLDYDYVAPVVNHHFEVDEHKLVVRLNKIGKSFLILEDFFGNGLPDREAPEPPDEDDDMDEDEWQELQYRRALESDNT